MKNNTLKDSHTIINKHITLKWIPSRVWIAQNDAADELAKKGSKLSQIIYIHNVFYCFIKRVKNILENIVKGKNEQLAKKNGENKTWKNVNVGLEQIKNKPTKCIPPI